MLQIFHLATLTEGGSRNPTLVKMTMLEEAEKSEPSSPGMFGRIQRTVVGGMERAFCKYGEFAAK